MGAASFLGQLSVRPELREHRHFRHHLQRLSRQNKHPYSTYRERTRKSIVADANSYALRKYSKSTKSAFLLPQLPPSQLLMADNRLTGGLRGCVEAFLEYIPHVTWPSLLAERMLCALSSQSVLQSLRHSTGFPLRVICTENSGGQVPAGTIQVLARMVPAKALNWLQLAPKC